MIRKGKEKATRVLLFAVFTFTLQPFLSQRTSDNVSPAYRIESGGLLTGNGFQQAGAYTLHHAPHRLICSEIRPEKYFASRMM